MQLLVEESPKRGAKRNKTLIVFTLALFSLTLSSVALYTRNYQLEFIDNRDYPSGPMAWGRTQFGGTYLASSNAISTVISWLADGFLMSLAFAPKKRSGSESLLQAALPLPCNIPLQIVPPCILGALVSCQHG